MGVPSEAEGQSKGLAWSRRGLQASPAMVGVHGIRAQTSGDSLSKGAARLRVGAVVWAARVSVRIAPRGSSRAAKAPSFLTIAQSADEKTRLVRPSVPFGPLASVGPSSTMAPFLCSVCLLFRPPELDSVGGGRLLGWSAVGSRPRSMRLQSKPR